MSNPLTPRWLGPPIEPGQKVLVTDNFTGEGRGRILGRIGTIKRATNAYQEVEIDGTVYLLDSDRREIVPYWGQCPEGNVVPEQYLLHKSEETYRDLDTEETRPTYAALMAQECLRARRAAAVSADAEVRA